MFKVRVEVTVISDTCPDVMSGKSSVIVDESFTAEDIKIMCAKFGEQMAKDLNKDILPAMRDHEAEHKEAIFNLVTKEKEGKLNG